MNARRATTAAALAATLTAGVALATATPAAAKSGRVQASGSCSPSGHWKLKASPEGRRIELQLEVEAVRPGQRWTVVVTDNGTRVVSTARTASATRQLAVRALVPNRAGTDRFVATARNTVTGATCRGALTFAG
ncbi:MAG: hypothetical protein ACTHLJ_02155 [Angustibacter sp.]